jgi:Uma2 family endonuclease
MLTLAISTEHGVVVQGPPQGEWTAADWEVLPHGDGNRYEIIEGCLYVSTSPSLFHNWIIRRLDAFVGIPAEERGLGFVVTMQAGVFMPGAQPVQPDFAFVKAERAAMMRERRIYGVPDLIVEVLSPGNREYDVGLKRAVYEKAGVAEYGVIDALERTLSLHRLSAHGHYGAPLILGGSELVTFACLPELPFALNVLFDGAPDTTV